MVGIMMETEIMEVVFRDYLVDAFTTTAVLVVLEKEVVGGLRRQEVEMKHSHVTYITKMMRCIRPTTTWQVDSLFVA